MTNQISLGTVIIAGKEKLAVATIYDDEGKAVTLDPAKADLMTQVYVKELYRKIIQDIVNEHKYYQPDIHGKMDSISITGITYSKVTPAEAQHTVAKTDQMWKAFVAYIMDPEMIDKYKIHINLIDKQEFDEMGAEEKFKLMRGLLWKREAEMQGRRDIQYSNLERIALAEFRKEFQPHMPIENEVAILAERLLEQEEQFKK